MVKKFFKMKTLILLLFPLFLSGQIYNQDTTWTLNYAHITKLRTEIETSKAVRQKLNDELALLYEKSERQDIIIRNVKLRDSLATVELQKADEIEAVLREKLALSNDIISKYRILLFSTEDQLRVADKKRRNAELWKTIYKYGFPAVGLLTLLLLR
jgi:hypothetical protein